MEFVFREPRGTWVRVEGSEFGIRVFYQPTIRRDGMVLKVYDHDGVLLDEHDMLHSAPSSSELEVCEIKVRPEDWETTTRWVAAHLASGLQLSRAEAVVDDGVAALLHNWRYEVSGIVGRLLLQSDGVVMVLEDGEVLELEDGQIGLLWPAGEIAQSLAPDA